MKLSTVLRWCNDIGMFVIDRSRESSCVHATEFCAATCYNAKLESAFGHTIKPKDQLNDLAWQANDVSDLGETLARKRRQTRRMQLATRGEPFATLDDVGRVARLLEASPAVLWWVPTRAWRDPVLWNNVRALAARYPNVRVLASTDPTTTDAEYLRLERQGASTMFYGDNRTETPSGSRMFRCPKTHRKLKAHCAICRGGCFCSSRPVHVHLKQH